MRRIMIIGSGGAGKSTLARQLGDLIDIPVVHLDALLWRPGWVITPRDEERMLVENLVRRESWIMDGNYGGTMEIRLGAADTVIFLDFPRTLCLWRAFTRWLCYRGRTRSDVGPECPEQLNREYIQWIWRYPTGNRPRVLELLQRYATGRQIVHLQSPRGLDDFLADLRLAQTRS